MSEEWINARIEKAMKALDDANSRLYFTQSKLAHVTSDPKLKSWIEDSHKMAIKMQRDAALELRLLTGKK